MLLAWLAEVFDTVSEAVLKVGIGGAVSWPSSVIPPISVRFAV